MTTSAATQSKSSGPTAGPCPIRMDRLRGIADGLSKTFAMDAVLLDPSGKPLHVVAQGALPSLSVDELMSHEPAEARAAWWRQSQSSPIVDLVVPICYRHTCWGNIVARFCPADAVDALVANDSLRPSGFSVTQWRDALVAAGHYQASASPYLLQAVHSYVHSALVNKEQGDELEQLSEQLLELYEEISLHYRLGQQFNINSRPEDVLAQTCRELRQVLDPACSVACITLQPDHWEDITASAAAGNEDGPTPRQAWRIRSEGPATLDKAHFMELFRWYQRQNFPWGRPYIHDQFQQLGVFTTPVKDCVRLLIVPLCYQSELLGLLVAFADDRASPFDSADAKLLSNVATQTAAHWKYFLLFDELRQLLYSLVRALVSAIDAKDPYTRGHSERVASVSRQLAEKLGLSRQDVEDIYLSGLLHDIGKIGIREDVLQKRGPLTDEEWDHIKLHPEIGARILEPVAAIAKIIPGVRFHHECSNGRGYPLGLVGDEIPLMARIIAVADSFDAMSSERPYRKAMPTDKIRDIFANGSGIQWDPRPIAAFLELMDNEVFRNEYLALLDQGSELQAFSSRPDQFF